MNPDEIADLLGIELEKIDGFMEELKRDKQTENRAYKRT